MTHLIDGLPSHLPQEVRDRILARRAQKATASEPRATESKRAPRKPKKG